MIPENPRILLTNDDGADAPGLQTLQAIAQTLSDDIWTVAPRVEQSGASRGISLHDPLRVKKLGERYWSVTGTPTDCVMLAVGSLMGDTPPDSSCQASIAARTWPNTSPCRAPSPAPSRGWSSASRPLRCPRP